MNIVTGGLNIPAVGLGTWALKGTLCSRVVEQALRLGYRHIDTAQVYKNEREVGDGIRGSGVRREDIFVTSKVWTSHYAPLDLERSARKSLSRMRTGYIDLLLLHWPREQVPLEETLAGLARVQQLGIARNIGVSNFPIALMEQAISLSAEPIVCNQVEYHPFLDQSLLLAVCRRRDVAMVAYCPIVRGRVKKDAILGAIGHPHRKSPAQVCLRWLYQQNVPAIPGTSKVERLSENLNIFDFELSEDEMRRVSDLRIAGVRLANPPNAPKWD